MYQQLAWASQVQTKNQIIEYLMNKSCTVEQRSHRSTASIDMSVRLRMMSVCSMPDRFVTEAADTLRTLH